jgi:hypothetical protein
VVTVWTSTVPRGVRWALTLKDTGDAPAARPRAIPISNLAFADFGRRGFATVRARPQGLKAEYVLHSSPDRT